ncbi:MAG: RNA repair transcriptional activator RtcR family protein [Microscillaceae bacterium]|nr:RNA repair transcriptional activator RtcR family protein [Microscillaceae bacterium]
MAKILLSWLAYDNDFLPKERGLKLYTVNEEESPNYNLHLFHWKFDRHIILLAEDTDETKLKGEILELKLLHIKPQRSIEMLPMHIRDIIDMEEIYAKVRSLLSGLLREGHEISLFITPGTMAMQISWFLCHWGSLSHQMWQLRPRRYSEGGKPEFIKVEILQSQVPIAIWLSEIKKNSSNFLFTPTLKKVFDLAKKVAKTEVSVLIQGESGTGKEHLAATIHNNSSRKYKKMITVNCSALSDQLLESRLFGYKKGAFTGADTDRDGFFKEADQSTLFLDEIGDISPALQQSLLRVLQNGEIIPIGATEPIKVDVRIIAATHRNLLQMCSEDKFRWDLYYRLSVVELEIPPLRERGEEEIETLMDHFIEEFKITEALNLSPETRKYLKTYRYRGNVRELENLISGLYARFADENKLITLEDLPKRMSILKDDLSDSLANATKKHIIQVFEKNDRKIKPTARALDITPITLKKHLDKYGLRNDPNEEED